MTTQNLLTLSLMMMLRLRKLRVSLLTQLLSKRTQRVCCISGNVFFPRGLYTLVTEGPIFFWEVLGFDIGEVIIRFATTKSDQLNPNGRGSILLDRTKPNVGTIFHCRLDGRAVCPTLAASLAPSFSEPSRLRFIFLFFLTSVTLSVRVGLIFPILCRC